MMMKPRKPDVLDALMSAEDDDDMPDEDESGEIAVMAFPDDDEAAAEPEEGTPQATIADIRRGLDELEAMFAGE